MKRTVIAIITLMLLMVNFSGCDKTVETTPGSTVSAQPTATASPTASPIASPTVSPTVSPTPSSATKSPEEYEDKYSGGGWEWEPGQGDPAQLDAAVLAIENTRLRFKGEFVDNESALNRVSEALRTVLKDIDVYVYNVTLYKWFMWDGFSSGGIRCGGKGCYGEITLAAGQDRRIVTERYIMFSYPDDPAFP